MSAALDRLDAALAAIGRVAVAVSGGVDSLTLATAAQRRLGAAARMYHAISPAVPPEATARTQALAAARGWALDTFDAGEFSDADYRANPANRCFFCKTNLYRAVAARSEATVVSGTNTDDLADWRPGLAAAREHGVRHPYVEAGIDKATIRALAAELGLGVLAELPASPCLSSRVETGIRIEPAVLQAIDLAERQLRAALSPRTVRCRVRAAGIVVELDAETLARVDPPMQARLAADIEALLGGRVRFAPYRAGSAFLRPAA